MSDSRSTPAGTPVLTADLILLCGSALQAIEGDRGASPVRNLSGWSSQLQVPVPWGCHKPIDEGLHRPVICRVLQLISAKLFPERSHDPDQPSGEVPHGRSFKLSDLRNVARVCGIPLNLRRSLVFLFENFGTILANPRLFE